MLYTKDERRNIETEGGDALGKRKRKKEEERKKERKREKEKETRREDAVFSREERREGGKKDESEAERVRPSSKRGERRSRGDSNYASLAAKAADVHLSFSLLSLFFSSSLLLHNERALH
ncbi:hypothetical protein X777_00356 [Ooceraea biroi]|uniref:Uncharacterized protein n=1 Tax=Ooceraea biroi TaxID=2015173 RepID=A0A026WU47_OOCBI|nr:hypothetical protein X777_00356 [Ooceraea biroi]